MNRNCLVIVLPVAPIIGGIAAVCAIALVTLSLMAIRRYGRSRYMDGFRDGARVDIGAVQRFHDAAHAFGDARWRGNGNNGRR